MPLYPLYITFGGGPSKEGSKFLVFFGSWLRAEADDTLELLSQVREVVTRDILTDAEVIDGAVKSLRYVKRVSEDAAIYFGIIPDHCEYNRILSLRGRGYIPTRRRGRAYLYS
jgi:hypothetical protein